MNADMLSYVFQWGTLLQWIVVGTLFFVDAVRVHWRMRSSYKAAQSFGNGRALVLRYRMRISRWFMIGSAIGLAVGLGALFRAIALPQPPSTTRIFTAIITEGLIVMFFAFWRAKRGQIGLIKAIDARHLSQLEAAREEARQEEGDIK